MRTQASFFEIGKKSDWHFTKKMYKLKKAYEKMLNIIFQCESEVVSRVWLFATLWTVAQPGSSVHGVLQARILERVAISFSRGSSWPGYRTQVSRISGRRFNLWATREAQ